MKYELDKLNCLGNNQPSFKKRSLLLKANSFKCLYVLMIGLLRSYLNYNFLYIYNNKNSTLFQYISNKMQLYTVNLYLETALHVSGGTTTHYQERKELYLQHLVFVTPLLLPAAIAAGNTFATGRAWST